MKKVAFYIESMILGGAEKVLIDIANRLDPSLFDVTIISIYKESVYSSVDTYHFKSLINDNVHLVSLVDNSRHAISNVFNHLYARIDKSIIYKALIKDKYDIEVAFYEGMPTEFVAHSTNKQSKKYAWLHTNNDRLYADKASQSIDGVRDIYNRYDCVIGVSKNTTESFLRYFPDFPCTTIHNGVDLSEIRNKAREDCDMKKTDKMSFITVGRLVPVKGYERLLEACKDLLQDGYEFSLYMIGDGSERRFLEEYIHRNGLDDMVIMLGQQDNPYKYFKLSDAYICSSVTEGFGLAIVEAMSCGLPILTTDFPGINEIIGESIDAWNICDNSKEGIYRVLKEVLDDPQKLEDLSSLSLLQSKQFNINKQIDKIQELFMNGVTSWTN